MVAVTSKLPELLSSSGAWREGPWATHQRTLTSLVRVSVVIPALNEAKNLPHVLSRLPDGLHEVILVVGDSTDGTPGVALHYCPDIRLIKQRGRGKGNALAEGFAAATGDIIVMLDADGSADAEEIPRFVGALLAGADFAKGSRFLHGGGSEDITRFRRLGNRGLMWIVNASFGTRYTDLCYGFNAFWAKHLNVIDVDCDGFEVETLMNCRVAKAGLRVWEVPSFEFARIHGTSNLRSFRDGWRVLTTIASERPPGLRLFKRPHIRWHARHWDRGRQHGLAAHSNGHASPAAQSSAAS